MNYEEYDQDFPHHEEYQQFVARFGIPGFMPGNEKMVKVNELPASDQKIQIVADNHMSSRFYALVSTTSTGNVVFAHDAPHYIYQIQDAEGKVLLKPENTEFLNLY
jgi:hypothetical protein